MERSLPLRLAMSAFLSFGVATGAFAQSADKPQLLLRLDDVGMNHAVNSAIARVAEINVPFSVSVMTPTPWFEEAVEILKQYPQISVGVHLVLNSEWKNYRWGPVLGKQAVPTLVDSIGYFYPSTAEFLEQPYDLGEVERELSAQVERALDSGLKVDYVDYHMGTAVATPELREVVERVARKYNLGISRYFGESYRTMFDTPIADKQSSFLSYLDSLQPDAPNLMVVHVAEATPEMNVLFDRNNAAQNAAGGEPLVAKHRQAELDALLSKEFAELLKSGRLELITYSDLVQRMGLPAMRPPQ